MSLSDLLPANPISQELIFGVVIGLISKADGDPDNLNRVQVTFPTLTVGSAWARVASFYAGPNKGAFFFPAQDDEVLIAFEQGDTSRPYVIGVLWNGQDTPPVPADQTAMVRQIQTASGAMLKFDDTNEGTSITITDKTGNSIVIDTQANNITISSTQDLTLSAPDGTISINGGTVVINASEGLTLTTDANATLAADGELTLTGAMINLN
ncbi:MAG: phage baseplate assembly protein V [Caulobacter sp.]|nr:phage baseplate assembly protein V [Caulobacter sp.]